MYDVFAAAYGSSNVALWHGGFDMDEWPTTASSDREIDVLVYDKVRWNRENVVPALTAPFQRIVEELGLRTEVVTYGAYERERYLELLQRSRSMLFLCEHETQGMAYQEAMASGVAVLAWDNGFWLDPRSSSVSDTPIPASSVPYFSQTCGARFSAPSELDTTFREFWNHIDDFAPRDFVAEHLSMAQSADIFMNLYDALR
jgi:glycosyltransferase involved in cell wall biosynthesis